MRSLGPQAVKLYKYRDFSKPVDADFERLQTLLQRRAFWCARPDTLNDPVEFAWTCDYATTADTVDLLSELLIRVRGRTRDEARGLAAQAVGTGRLSALAEPVVAGLIQQCRGEIGVACFGTAPDNEVLWQRYGGCGAGVCIELDVPDSLLGTQLFKVQYSDAKRIHIDQLISAFLDPAQAGTVYTLALLSKPSSWSAEEEVRFISRKQSVAVVIDGSRIARVVLGDALTPSARQRIERTASPVPVVSRSPTEA